MRPIRALLAISAVFAAIAPASAQTILYVNASLAAGADDGSSWSSAFRGPQALKRAMDLAPAGGDTQIWVAQGRYTAAPPSGSRRASFILKSGVAVYGGFAGGETALTQRNPAAHPVTLSADLNNDDQGQHTTENTVHLVQAIGTDNTARLDGLILRDGYAWGLVGGGGIEDTYGANLLLDGSDAVLVNCTISDAFAADGAGVHADHHSNPTFIDCLFTRNTCQGLGGALRVAPGSSAHASRCDFIANLGGLGAGVFNGWILGSTTPSTVTLEDCRFIDNGGEIGLGAGPGLFDCSSSTLIRCQFHRNRTVAGGGAIFSAGSGVTAVSCEFTENEGSFDGGDALRLESGFNRFVNCLFHAHGGPGSPRPSGLVIAVLAGRSDFTNCTFANNNLQVATSSVGITAVMANGPGVEANFDNCIFWNNRDHAGFSQAAAIHAGPGAAVKINDSIVQGWTGSIPGARSFAADPAFADLDGPDQLAGTPDDDLRLSLSSPAIDAANSAPLLAALALVPQAGLNDAAGLPRFVDMASVADTGLGTPPLADRGAHEMQPACPADLNGDGLVEFPDYLVFLTYFDAADLRADFNHDGVIDFPDYLEFLTQYDAGC